MPSWCYRWLQVNEKGKDSLRELPYEIVDFDTGQYEAPVLSADKSGNWEMP
jgi:hypothetical protein